MTNNSQERKKAIIALIVTATMWSFGGLLIKLVDWPPLAIAGTRSAIGSLIMLAALRREKLVWTRTQLIGAIGCAVAITLFVLANKLTTAANAILLQYSSPIYIALFGNWFLGERTTRFDWLMILVVLVGLALFFLDGLSPAGFWGNICALLSGVGFAVFALCMRKEKSGSPLQCVLLGNLVTTLICLPFMFPSMPSTRSWLGLLTLGIFQLGLPDLFYAYAVKHVRALDSILIMLLEPILSPIWALLLIREAPGLFALIGGLIVLAALTTRSLLVVWQQPQPVSSN